MKKIWMILISLLVATASSACSPDDDPAGLENALGAGNVNVKFEIIEN